MKALISGGTGFIGNALAARLTREGHEVVSTCRRPPSDPLPNVRYVHVDFANRNDVERSTAELAGIDAFFHVASGINWKTEFSPEGMQLAREEIVHPLRFLEALGPSLRRVVFASSLMVYPLVSASLLVEGVDEAPSNFYGVHKLVFEDAARVWAQNRGCSFVAARIGQTYGKNMRVNRILPDTIEKARHNAPIEIFGNGSTCLDWVHVDDVVDGLMRCASFDGQDAFNIGTGEGVTSEQLVRSVVKALGSTSVVSFAPERRVVPQHQIMSPVRAKSSIGYERRLPFERGLAQMLSA